MRKTTEVAGELISSTDSGDGSRISDLVMELWLSCLFEGELPLSAFEVMMSLLENDHFLRFDDSWKLIHALSDNWSLLSATQRGALAPLLPHIFDKHKDGMGAFVIAELMGGQCANIASVTAFRRLLENAAKSAQGFIPNGIGVLAQNPGVPEEVRRDARELLHVLIDHPTPDVSSEASLVLARVSRDPGR